MFGKAPSFSANKSLFGSSLPVDCQSVFHLRTSFPSDLRNGTSFSKNSARFTLSDPAAVPYLLYWMARDKDGGRGDLRQKIDLAFG